MATKYPRAKAEVYQLVEGTGPDAGKWGWQMIDHPWSDEPATTHIIDWPGDVEDIVYATWDEAFENALAAVVVARAI
jgi:hypothetical protein